MKFNARQAANRYAETDFRYRDRDTPYPELSGFETGYSLAIQEVFDGAEFLLTEAEGLMHEHPSKDARFFAASVAGFLRRMFETPEDEDE